MKKSKTYLEILMSDKKFNKKFIKEFNKMKKEEKKKFIKEYRKLEKLSKEESGKEKIVTKEFIDKLKKGKKKIILLMEKRKNK